MTVIFDTFRARLNFRLWCALGTREAGLGVIALLKRSGCEVSGRYTGLTIEGFPRSGNTFAYASFCEMQNNAIRIAHHVHGAAQLTYAAKRGTPAVLLLREPTAACTSLLVRQPALTASCVLKYYSVFHSRIWPVRKKLVVMRFDVLVSKPEEMVEKVNRRFGTGFRSRPLLPDLEVAIRERVADMDTADRSRHRDHRASAGFPSVERAEKNELVRRRILSPEVQTERLAALDWYNRFRELSA